MAKRRGYEVPQPQRRQPDIVTSLDGRPLSSLPKSQRRAARRAVQSALAENPWDNAHIDPESLRRQAHIAANSRHRGNPTRAASNNAAIRASRGDW